MPPKPEPMLTDAQFRAIVSEPPISDDTARRWRELGYGPPFVRIGRRVFYRKADVAEWLASRTFTSTAAEAARKSAA